MVSDYVRKRGMTVTVDKLQNIGGGGGGGGDDGDGDV